MRWLRVVRVVTFLWRTRGSLKPCHGSTGGLKSANAAHNAVEQTDRGLLQPALVRLAAAREFDGHLAARSARRLERGHEARRQLGAVALLDRDARRSGVEPQRHGIRSASTTRRLGSAPRPPRPMTTHASGHAATARFASRVATSSPTASA